MPSTPGQGQGQTTRDKEIGFDAVMRRNARLAKNVMRKNKWVEYSYWHFDLNAGKGWNDTAQVLGSPILAIHAIRDYFQDKHFCFFVDISGDAIGSLSVRKEIDPERHFLHLGDNSDFASSIPHLIKAKGEKPYFALGSVYCDPNATDVPMDALAALAKECNRLDIIINVQCTSFKRTGSAFPISSLHLMLQKKYWLIRRHSPSDPWQSTILIGSNGDFDAYESKGLVFLDSPEGQRIARQCEHTRAELNGIRD